MPHCPDPASSAHCQLSRLHRRWLPAPPTFRSTGSAGPPSPRRRSPDQSCRCDGKNESSEEPLCRRIQPTSAHQRPESMREPDYSGVEGTRTRRSAAQRGLRERCFLRAPCRPTATRLHTPPQPQPIQRRRGGRRQGRDCSPTGREKNGTSIEGRRGKKWSTSSGKRNQEDAPRAGRLTVRRPPRIRRPAGG